MPPPGGAGQREPAVWRRLASLAHVLVLACTLVASTAAAHEMQASIADIDLTGGRVTIELRTNGEALLAGIGAEHDDTDESPRSAEYDALRALPPGELEARLGDFAPTLLDALIVAADDEPVPLAVQTIAVDDQPDPELVRDTRMTLSGELPGGAEAVTVRLDPERGDLILRGTGENRDYGEFLQAGARSAPIAVPDRSMWDAVRGLFGG